jgi:hypothetical protein
LHSLENHCRACHRLLGIQECYIEANINSCTMLQDATQPPTNIEIVLEIQHL